MTDISTKNLRVGLIGLGKMGQNHLRILKLIKDLEVVFVHDIDSTKATQIAQSLGINMPDSLRAKLPLADAVVIVAPTSTHVDYVLQCSEFIRNIFVEKPMATSYAEALHLQAQLQMQNRPTYLQVGFIERYNPAVVQLRTILKEQPQIINLDFTRTNKVSSRITDVDVITDLMIHDLDLAIHLNGPVRTVQAHGLIRQGMADFAQAQLIHTNGSASRVLASRITDKKLRRIEAYCSDAFIDCDLLRKEIQISKQSETVQKPGMPYKISTFQESVEVPSQEALLSELVAFVTNSRMTQQDALASNCPGLSDAISALHVAAQINEAIYAK
jgi:predicted dehydrogenase